MRTIFSGLLALSSLVVPVAEAQDYEQLAALPRKTGVAKMGNAAFLTFDRFHANEPWSLLVSSFAVFGGTNAVNMVSDVGRFVFSPEKMEFTELSRKITWPNEVKVVPAGVFSKPAVSVSGGFLVPGQSNGAVTIIDIASKDTKVISQMKSGWFYHRVEWRDMNGDGRLDALTARGMKSIFGSSGGELLWLENPGSESTGPWKEHVLAKGPDVNFVSADLDGDGKEEILVAQYFSKLLTLFWQEAGAWKTRILDDKIGNAFDVQVVDLNGDGRIEILATNHEGSNGSVFAYEIPADIRKDQFLRHTLATGIPTRQGGMNQAAPGQARTFIPYQGYTGKPYIIAAGDGSQRAHLLTPKSIDFNDWSYDTVDLVNAACTVGAIAVEDVNNDGYTDIMVPGYDKGEIHVFTYAP